MNTLNILFILLNIYLVFQDFKSYTLSNKMILSIIGISIIKMIFFYPEIHFFNNILASIVFSLPLFVIYCINDNAMGGGDVKYIFASGLYLGLIYELYSWYIMMGLVCLILLPMMIFQKIKRDAPIPLGTFIGISNIVVIFLNLWGVI